MTLTLTLTLTLTFCFLVLFHHMSCLKSLLLPADPHADRLKKNTDKALMDEELFFEALAFLGAITEIETARELFDTAAGGKCTTEH
jgi:hypothetical protein